MKNIIFLDCGNFSEPTGTGECQEVIWSEGASCRRCPNKKCYRNGWLKKQVDADNKKLFGLRKAKVEVNNGNN